ncbi:MAG TPA: hypothetical protein VNK50_14430, partial [Calidithermus sp.]|nr:hypothetical protein [Calidithermus sp.]
RRPAVAPRPAGAPVAAPAPPAPLSAVEREAFERRKLELRIAELTRQLGEASSRAAALHFRLWRVTEDRNVLELNLAGERGANQLAEQALDDLRRENERLRAELAALRAGGQSAAGRP